MIRHPEGKLAGQTSDFFASTHDVPRTILSMMGIRAPGQMNGEDLSVIFDGKEPPERRWFTSCYDDHVLAGDADWFLLADRGGSRKRSTTGAPDPEELKTDVADENPRWSNLSGRTLEDEAEDPDQFGPSAPRGSRG